MKRLAPLALVAALALAGCTAGNQTADAMPSATTTPSATASESPSLAPSDSSESPTGTVYPTNSEGVTIKPWEDLREKQYLENSGANSYKGWDKEYPQRSTLSWEESGKGNLLITVKGNNWSKSQLALYAKSVQEKVTCMSTDVNKVTIQTGDMKVSATAVGC